jgi:murein DD-endopeptidase MepM/ murein hydrolase activator NlpD
MTRVMAGLLALFCGCLLVLLPLPAVAVDLPGMPRVPSVPGLPSGLPGVPNLPNLPSLPSVPGLPSLPGIAKIDIPFGSDREAKALYTISGSTRNDRFKPEPCTKGRCSNFELADAVKLPGLSIKGRQWVDKHQLVPGGKGFLASVNNGLEPTGLVPWGFGVPFKLVAEEINEDRGEVRFALYTRVCVRTPLADFGCTPFFIGPIPLPGAGTVSEGGDILIATSNPPPVVDIPPDLQATIDGIRGIYVPEPGGPLPVGSSDGCLIAGNYKEVDLGALGRAIALIESQGQANNGYQAVGTYVIDGPRKGRALGRYQFMSYGPAVQRIVLSRGGAAWLAKLEAGYKPTAEEVARYFPESEQGALMSDHLKKLINKAIAEGFTGDRLIARVAEMHNAGEFSRPGVAGGYASQAIASYKQMAGNVAANCAPTKVASRTCKPGQPCKLYHPLPGSVATSEFGPRGRRLHAGLDISSGGGKPVFAAWDGTVSRGWNCPNEVFITLTSGAPGGAQFVRMLHSSTVLVRPGQQVKRGQQVAQEGSVDCVSRSTGPHVHLEVGRRVQWGAQVNPRDFPFDPPLPPMA